MTRKRKALAASLCLALLGSTGLFAHEEDEVEPPLAPGSTWDPETCLSDKDCGRFGPLIPMTYNAVGAGMIWSTDPARWNSPKVHYKGRHSEFKPSDVYDPACVERLVLQSGYSAWPIPRSEWGVQFPTSAIVPGNIFFDAQTVQRFDPVGHSYGTKGLSACIRSSFKHLVYGGYNMIQGQSNFAGDRIRAYYDREAAQNWDISDPQAFSNRGIRDNALLDEQDALMNLHTFTNAGASRGLNYSIYSLGYATLSDGRVVHVGGHNMNSNSGFRKLNVYDPEANTWAPRPVPCNIANWRADPGGVQLGYKAFADAAAGGPGLGDSLVQPPAGAPAWPDCDQRVRDHVDPPHHSDLRYQRWYPSAITLPNGRAYVFGGVDQDESVGPNVNDPNRGSRDRAFQNSIITVPVSEVYDPATDRTVALENARMLYPQPYPSGTIVQTGTGVNDWKVCTLTGQPAPAAEASLPRSDATDEAAEWRRFCTEAEGPRCVADQRAIVRRAGTTPVSTLQCLDVQAAAADPELNIPAERHWQHVDTMSAECGYKCGSASIVKLGPNGQTLSNKWIFAGGRTPGNGPVVPDINYVDFAQPNPKFTRLQGVLYQGGQRLHLVALPDGTVYIRGGEGPNSAGTLEQREYSKSQLFDPDTDTVSILKKSTHGGGLHKTLLLLPDASVLTMGGDRSSMVAAGDRAYSPGDQDLGVSIAQVFEPPYLFRDAAGHPKPRPVIEQAPQRLTYRQSFAVKVDNAAAIKTVSIYRTGFVTHALHTDNRLVILNFQHPGASNDLVVDAPHLPAQAVPGDYMLFVVNHDGTPSVAKRIRLN